MFGFPIVAIPLSYLTLSAWFFAQSKEERLSKYYGRGLLLGIPCLLVHLLLYRIIPEMPGGLLYIFRIWWERYLLPTGLAVGIYRLLHTFDETIQSKASLRRFMAFLFGYFTLFSVVFTLRDSGFLGPFSIFFSPVLSIAIIFITIYLLERIVTETGIHAALWISAAILVSLAFACVAYLFYARLEWLGGILALITLAVSIYLERSILR